MRALSPAKREEILDLASQVFADVGYERATMDLISLRVGGSKATLYRYFPSKKELFLAAADNSARQHLGPALLEPAKSKAQMDKRLRELGSTLLAFLLLPDTIARDRMVIAEASQSDIGQQFYAKGAGMGLGLVSDFLQHAMQQGWLRKGDPRTAAAHVLALIQAETRPQHLFGVPVDSSPAFIRKTVDAGIDVFMRAYGI